MRLLDISKVEMVVDVPERLISNVPFVESIEVTFARRRDLGRPRIVGSVLTLVEFGVGPHGRQLSGARSSRSRLPYERRERGPYHRP